MSRKDPRSGASLMCHFFAITWQSSWGEGGGAGGGVGGLERSIIWFHLHLFTRTPWANRNHFHLKTEQRGWKGSANRNWTAMAPSNSVWRYALTFLWASQGAWSAIHAYKWSYSAMGCLTWKLAGTSSQFALYCYGYFFRFSVTTELAWLLLCALFRLFGAKCQLHRQIWHYLYREVISCVYLHLNLLFV